MKLLVTATLLWCGLAFAWVPESHLPNQLKFEGVPLPSSNGDNPRIGLYIGKGVWDVGREHLKMFFAERGFTYRTLTAAEILAGELANVKVLVMPGGESWEYLKELGPAGGEKIKAFVDSGGSYIGICAGAFYATSDRLGGYATGPYGIGLLQGTAYDGTALHTRPFIEGMMNFPILPTTLTENIPTQLRMVMFGGPSFRFSRDEGARKGLQVLAKIEFIDEPTMIAFNYGMGRVFLSGPHLEVEENRTGWGPAFTDPESDWPLLENIARRFEK